MNQSQTTTLALLVDDMQLVHHGDYDVTKFVYRYMTFVTTKVCQHLWKCAFLQQLVTFYRGEE